MLGIADDLKYDAHGLVPAIAQDYKTGEVLMLAYMNKEAIEKTLETKYAHYWSRSRKKLWLKGEESGHHQIVKSVNVDCDSDSVLIKVEQKEAACHTGHYSCFYKTIENESVIENSETVFDEKKVYANKAKILNDIYELAIDRKENPKEKSYTNYLFDKGIDKILKKVGEECAEIIIASKNNDKGEIVYEVSDFMYHLVILLVERNIQLDDIYNELIKRNKK